jgi:hypothetical protein
MQVIARQQNDLAWPDYEVLPILAIDPDAKIAIDDIVIEDQMGRWREKRCAMLGPDMGRYAPRREEVGVQEYTAGQMRHPQDLG